ncbi:MAG: potassium channel protein, partial [Syntrophales bacterium]|nr:potassium channel protein [Syntrophales bacterium]
RGLGDVYKRQSLYFTMVTISTVGYGDIYPLSAQGRALVIFLIIFGVGTMFYAIMTFSETIVEKQVSAVMGKGKIKKMIENLRDHYIICGCGRIGYLIAKELAYYKVPFVVVEKNPDVLERIEQEGFLFYRGDATEDRTLLAAGIERAAGIVCVLPTDAENLYVILTAKELNPRIFILSRSEEEKSEHRLLRAGADRVVSPYLLGGTRMAMAILKPAMLDFIEISTSRQSLDLRMEEMAVADGSPVVGQTLEESGIRQRYGLIIVAVKKPSGRMVFNPLASYVIEKGDKLIAMGEEENVTAFAAVCKG